MTHNTYRVMCLFRNSTHPAVIETTFIPFWYYIIFWLQHHNFNELYLKKITSNRIHELYLMILDWWRWASYQAGHHFKNDQWTILFFNIYFTNAIYFDSLLAFIYSNFVYRISVLPSNKAWPLIHLVNEYTLLSNFNVSNRFCHSLCSELKNIHVKYNCISTYILIIPIPFAIDSVEPVHLGAMRHMWALHSTNNILYKMMKRCMHELRNLEDGWICGVQCSADPDTMNIYDIKCI